MERDLLDLLSPVGEIVSVRRLVEFSGRFRGMVWCSCARQDATEQAITKFNGFVFKSRPLWVEYRTKPMVRRPEKGTGPCPDINAPDRSKGLLRYGYPAYPVQPSTYSLKCAESKCPSSSESFPVTLGGRRESLLQIRFPK
jgi:hypothetical protein